MDNSKKILSASKYFWLFLGLFCLYGIGGWLFYAIIKVFIERLVPVSIIQSILMIIASLFVTVVCIDLTITNMVYKRNIFTHKINIKKILLFTIIAFLMVRLLGFTTMVLEVETKVMQINSATEDGSIFWGYNGQVRTYANLNDISFEEAKNEIIRGTRITEYVSSVIGTLIGFCIDLLIIFVFQRRLLLKNCIENYVEED